MAKVLIIGAGAVSNVTTQKCAQVPGIFSGITLASRTIDKCRQIQQRVKKNQGLDIEIAAVDADNVKETVKLIEKVGPDLLLNIALPYQDLALMEACLETGVDYLDTANWEPEDKVQELSYKWQWDYDERFKEKGLMALLGSGFDPGVTSVFCTYALKHHFDEIHYIDILDCNAGDHGRPFATNFNPEVNIREITHLGKYWEGGQWIETDPLAVKFDFDYPQVGPKSSYLIYHEELESLVKFIPNLKRVRFWMTFSDNYLTHLRVIQNLGLDRIEPVTVQGHEIIPMKFLQAILPDPASLAPNYTGRTCIGCVVTGVKDGKTLTRFIYNVCDHEGCFAEVEAQAISYTAGTPATIGAMLMLEKKWKADGVVNIEQLDPDPFMEKLNLHGLPWQDVEFQSI